MNIDYICRMFDIVEAAFTGMWSELGHTLEEFLFSQQ